MSATVLKGPGGIRLEIDPDDEATPAMVYSADGRHSSTYDCALDTGYIDDAIGLTQKQSDWLEEFRSVVDQAFDEARSTHDRAKHAP